MVKNRIKERRKEQGFSQDELAELSGIPVSTIKNWENGHRTPGNVYELEKLARALNGTIYDIIIFD